MVRKGTVKDRLARMPHSADRHWRRLTGGTRCPTSVTRRGRGRRPAVRAAPAVAEGDLVGVGAAGRARRPAPDGADAGLEPRRPARAVRVQPDASRAVAPLADGPVRL